MLQEKTNINNTVAIIHRTAAPPLCHPRVRTLGGADSGRKKAAGSCKQRFVASWKDRNVKKMLKRTDHLDPNAVFFRFNLSFKATSLRLRAHDHGVTPNVVDFEAKCSFNFEENSPCC